MSGSNYSKVAFNALPKTEQGALLAIAKVLEDNECEIIDAGDFDSSLLGIKSADGSCLTLSDSIPVNLENVRIPEETIIKRLNAILRQHNLVLGVVAEYEDRDFGLWDTEIVPSYLEGNYTKIDLSKIKLALTWIEKNEYRNDVNAIDL